MHKFLAINVGWVRCARYRYVKLLLDYERTVTQQSTNRGEERLSALFPYETEAGFALVGMSHFGDAATAGAGSRV